MPFASFFPIFPQKRKLAGRSADVLAWGGGGGGGAPTGLRLMGVLNHWIVHVS